MHRLLVKVHMCSRIPPVAHRLPFADRHGLAGQTPTATSGRSEKPRKAIQAMPLATIGRGV